MYSWLRKWATVYRCQIWQEALLNASFQLFFANGVVWSKCKSKVKASIDDWAIKSFFVFYSSIAFLCVLKHFNNGNAVPMRSGSFPTMGTAFPRVPPRNHPCYNVSSFDLQLSVVVNICAKIRFCHCFSNIKWTCVTSLKRLWHRQFSRAYVLISRALFLFSVRVCCSCIL